MALTYFYGARGQDDPRQRQILAAQLIGQGFGQFNQARTAQKQQDALGQLLAGKPGEGLGKLTQQHARGMDPSLAGPALALREGGMAQQGLLHTGKLTPEMAQAFTLQGGDPRALMSLMPQQGEGFTLGEGDVRFDAQGRQVAAGPAAAPEPMSVLGKIASDIGVDIRTPEGFQRALEVMQSTNPPGTNVEVKMPAQYPAAPQGMHYSGDFSRPETVQLQQTPGFQPEISGDAARVNALAPGALQDLGAITSGLVSPDGSINRSVVAQMNLPLIGDIPGTTGSGLLSKMEGALDLMTVMRTGASATASQMDAYRRAYVPSPLDSDATIRDKLARFQRDVSSALAINRQGRGEVPAPEAPAAGPAEPSMMDQFLQQGLGAVQQFMGGEGQAPAIPPATGLGFPPVEQRQAGQVYTNSQGVKGRWTGQGWEVVQ